MTEFNNFYQKLTKKNIQPMYLLYGESNYFIQLFKDKLCKVSEEEIGEEIIEYDARETAIQDILIDVETIPFFTNKKLIIVNHAYFFTAKQEKVVVDHQIDHLLTYLENPTDYSILLFIVPYEKLDERKKLTKLARKHAEVVPCTPLKEKNLRKWLIHLAKEQKISLSEDVCDLLEAEFDTNLSLLEQEIYKMALYVGENGHVTYSIAQELIAASPQQSALQLVDAVLQNNLHEAIHIYKGLTKMNEEEIGLLALLSYQFRIILQVKLYVEKGFPLQKIQSLVKVHPYVVKLARERSDRYTRKQLEYIIHLLTDTDEKIKTGQMDKGIAFEMLLFELVTISNQ